MIYLTLPELLHVAGRVLGPEVAVRDYGLLEAALARPQATAFGKDAYPDLDAKAAALLHSLARNHALIDGNKRLGLAAVIAFYGLNGRRLTLTNDQAYDLVMKVAAGELDHVAEIAAILQTATAPRRNPALAALAEADVARQRHRALEQAGVHERLRQVAPQLPLADVELLGVQRRGPAGAPARTMARTATSTKGPMIAVPSCGSPGTPSPPDPPSPGHSTACGTGNAAPPATEPA